MLIYIFDAFLIACISWVYMSVLREFLLTEWFLFGYNHFGKYEDWRQYVYKPIWGCELCFSGQLSLWMFFNLYEDYGIFYHLGFIALSILFTKLIYAAVKDN